MTGLAGEVPGRLVKQRGEVDEQADPILAVFAEQRQTGWEAGPRGADNLPALVAVRDSKDPTGPVLAFTPDAWRAFVGSDVVRR